MDYPDSPRAYEAESDGRESREVSKMLIREAPPADSAPLPGYARILVPVDGSALAEAVLPHVVSLAKRYGSTIELVRAYTTPPSLIAASAATSMPGSGPMIDPAPFIKAGKQEADLCLERLADQLEAAGVTVERKRLDGSAGESIVIEARAGGADLIAMTTHGRGGLGRLVLGSVADYVLQHAPCPLLLLRSAA